VHGCGCGLWLGLTFRGEKVKLTLAWRDMVIGVWQGGLDEHGAEVIYLFQD